MFANLVPVSGMESFVLLVVVVLLAADPCGEILYSILVFKMHNASWLF